jgi:hypothetical protein
MVGFLNWRNRGKEAQDMVAAMERNVFSTAIHLDKFEAEKLMTTERNLE